MNFDKAIFSHNESPTAENGGTKQDVITNLQLIKDIRAGIMAEFAKGTPGGKIPATLKLPQYEDFVGYDECLESIFRFVYGSLSIQRG